MEKEKKKSNKLVIILIIIILLLLLLILFLLFGKKSYTISFDTDGGSLITDIKVENGEIVTLPSEPTKEGYIFTGWTNEEGLLITEGMVVIDDLSLKANWIDEDSKTVSVSFKSDDNEVIKLTVEKNGTIIIPVSPVKEGYTFVGWLNSDGKIVTGTTKVSKNIELTALWIKNDIETSKVTVDTDGGNNIGNIIVENGKVISLPTNPVKPGYVFAGWVDSEGNKITEKTVINGNITIKATWKQPYTCPSNCTPSEDGKTCTREVTTEKTTVMGCPSGYKQINGKCLDTNNQILPDVKETCSDGTTPVNNLCMNQKRKADSGYDCVGKEYYEDGYCIMTSTYTNVCPSGYYLYTEVENMGAVDWCAKKVDKVSSIGCPSGYKESGNICKKTETVKCTKN